MEVFVRPPTLVAVHGCRPGNSKMYELHLSGKMFIYSMIPKLKLKLRTQGREDLGFVQSKVTSRAEGH